jgi:gliding motility-associated-like protein
MPFRLKHIHVLLCFIGVINSSFGQDLCSSTNPNRISNGFEFLTPNEGCGPLTVKLKDKTGGTDIKYIYYYQGEEKSKLSSLGPVSETENTYFTPPQTSTYTILQYGKKQDGTEFYSCGNVVVRVNNEPFFTTSACNNSILQVNIPDSSINYFDCYEITWDDGNPTEKVNNSDLPFSKTKNYLSNQPTRNIKVEGKFLMPVTGCTAAISRTIEMKSGSNYPNIDYLEVLNQNRIKLVFTGAANQFYDVYKRKINENSTFGSPSYSLRPGEHELAINSKEQLCFSLFRNFGCMETSGEICTVNLDSIKEVGLDNFISWNSHPNNNRVYFGGGIPDGQTKKIAQYLLVNSVDSSFQIPVIGASYSDNSIDCQKKVCYQIKTEVSGTARGSDQIPFSGVSVSNLGCSDRSNFKPDSLSNLWVTIEDNRPNISFIDNSNWPLEKEIFYLNHFKNGVFTIIDSTIENSIITNVDASSSSNCFFISYKDICGNTSKPSPEVCSILLETDGDKEISWQKSLPFALQNIVGYDILALDENALNFNSIYSNNSFNSGQLEPNLGNFENEVLFYIRAISSSGIESNSNIISIPISSKIFIPTAFSPNNDGKNEYFEIFGNTKTFLSFEIFIYNKWGQIIYQSTDKDFKWDGKYKGKAVPKGVYPYLIDGLSSRKEIIIKQGIINII